MRYTKSLTPSLAVAMMGKGFGPWGDERFGSAGVAGGVGSGEMVGVFWKVYERAYLRWVSLSLRGRCGGGI